MKKMKTKNKCLVTSLAIIAMLMMSVGVKAQNVTIGPKNGSIITGQAGGNVDDSGILRGMGSLWRHEQLPLTMTTSDIAMLTAAGELADPSCAIDKYDVDGAGNKPERLIIGAGQTQTFVVVSLPKGYRITGYRLVLQPDIYGNGIRLHTGKNTWDIGNDDHMRFYETEAWGSVAPYTTSTTGNNSNTHCTITDLRGNGYSYITVAHEIGNDNNFDMYNNNDDNRAKQFVIERTAKQDPTTKEWDMSNQLHFFFARGSSQYALSINSFEINFTAEGTFNTELTPTNIGEATSVVQCPFSTSKMDIGSLKYNTTTQLYYYDYTTVQDLPGYNWLYQKDAVSGGKPANVAENKHIYPVFVDGKGVYAFGNDTYFVEPPTTINTASGWESPIGFRVVGAKFDYQWGTDTEGETQTISDACYIRGRYPIATQNGYNTSNTDGYLNDQLDITNSSFAWQIDEWHNIYKEYTNGAGEKYRKYLACFGSDENERVLSLSTSATGTEAKWNLRIEDANGNNARRVYYEDSQGQRYYMNWRIRQEGSKYHSRCYLTKGTNTNLCSATTGETHTINTPSFHAGPYVLTIYGTDKDTPIKTITVNSAADADTCSVKGLNNDALMFKISGLTPKTVNGQQVETQAIVKVTLMLEALNPYIDKMDIVCHDDAGNLELTQSFTSSDFSVSGGKFIFYVPNDYRDIPLTFTFSDLYSKYGDKTYYDDVEHMRMNGNARYSYVTSNYFKSVSGNQVSGIADFPVNYGLYNNPNYSEDANYKTKVFTSTAGNVRFKFNNAEDLVSATGSLVEYPFSVSTYLSNYKDPDWKESSGTTQETGKFIPCKLIANPSASPSGTQYEKSDVFYVFTADETRYNIAPTTALQHRYYAFYRMDIELEARTFTPKFTWTKIYDKTFLLHNEVVKDNQGNVTSSKEVELDDSMWGLTLDVNETDDNGKKVKGYFTYQEIIDNILGRPASGNVPAIQSMLDPSNKNAPKYMRQILYVDGTPLSAMLNSSQNSVVKKLQDLRDSLAVNSLVFLPVNTTSTLDNTAFKTLSGAFRAGKDIVLTDKQPFYSPYDIQVDAANKATYTRVLTQADYGQATNATIMLPFTIAVDNNGLHTNPDGNCSFTVNTMISGKELKPVEGSSVDCGTAYFKPISDETTKANTPYMIKVESIDGSVSNNKQISFIATQNGSGIAKTPTDVTISGFSGKVIKGEYASGSYKDETYYFTNYASYSGGKFDRNVSENVFYFAKNKYVDLHTMYPASQQYLYSFPFRGAYTYSTSNPSANPAKLMGSFIISYDLDDMESMGITTELEKLGTKPDLMIRSDRGLLTITASRTQDVVIRSVNGMVVKDTNVEAGNTTTVALPAGIYLVNNTKITVK